MNAAVQHIIESTDAVPSVPHIVTRLLDVTNDPNFKQADVVRVLSSDPGVASDILRMANSALFGGQVRTATLGDALTRLGVRRIRTLVISRAMIVGLSAAPTRSIDSSYYWRRSLATAVLASQAADRLKLALRDQAFIGGLLCDVGVVILARALPVDYAPIAELYGPHAGQHITQIELERLNVTHADVGAAAMTKWSLPEELITAIRNHHVAASTDTSPSGRLARALGACSEIARVLCESNTRQEAGAICRNGAAAIGLSGLDLREILQRVEKDIEELATILHVDVIASKVYKVIAEELASTVSVSA